MPTKIDGATDFHTRPRGEYGPVQTFYPPGFVYWGLYNFYAMFDSLTEDAAHHEYRIHYWSL